MAKHSRQQQRDDDDVPPARLSGQALRDAARLFAYLGPYRLKFAAALVALLGTSLLALAFPNVTGRLVDGAIAANLGGAGAADVNRTALALFGLLGLLAVCTFFKALWFAEVGQRSLADLRQDAYARLIRLPMAFHAQCRVGELASRISADLTQIQDTIIWIIPQFLRQITILIGGVVLLALTSGKLTLTMLLSVPLLVFAARYFGGRIHRIAREAQDRLADSLVIVDETLQGIANVKAFANERYESGRYRDSMQMFLAAVLRSARYRAGFTALVVFALFGAIVLVLWYGARLVQTGEMTAGDLTQFMLYTMFVGGAMGNFADQYGEIRRALGASQRVRELLQETPELTEPPADHANGQAHPRLRGDVELEQVWFSYPTRQQVQVLRGVSLSARAGERVALVGPSGAGKSTIAALLLRFYEPDAGRLLFDGRDARALPLLELRRQLALVPQDVLLFGGTIAENIAYGRPGAEESEIIEAARQANAHDFISGFPDGYRTRVGERGVQLSGGQRQRIAIARAILKDPAILILDEATSSLDSESESLVQQALERLMRGRTCFIIAHRLATVRSADRIFVIKEGDTVESGTHAELLEREDGLYRTLCELQFDLS
jgi:ATP-binding cassette subfamily B protein